MGAHQLPLHADRALRNGFYSVVDPGASGTISWHNKGLAICQVVTATAESRALPAASGFAVGTHLLVMLKTDGGDLQITGATSGTVTLDDAGELVEFVVTDADGTHQWHRLIAVTAATSLALDDDVSATFGAGDDLQILFSTADASNHTSVIALDDTSQQIHITDVGAKASDWARSAGTHPEVAIHSNTTPITDYLAIGNHDGTTAHINIVGGTTLSFDVGGTASFTADAGGINFADSVGVAFGTGDDASILFDGSSLEYDVDTGGDHDFQVNATSVLAISATAATFAATCFPVLPITDTDGTVEGSIWYDASEDKLKFKTAAGVETITSA